MARGGARAGAGRPKMPPDKKAPPRRRAPIVVAPIPPEPMSKPFVPTAEQRQNVEAMTGFGIAQEDIARLIKNPETGKPLDMKSLRKHFPDEVATGLTKANAAVAQSLFAEATKGEDASSRVSAAKFWLSRRAGWKETTVTEHVGKDGEPIDVRHSIELKLDRLAQTLARRAPSDTDEGAAGSDPAGV